MTPHFPFPPRCGALSGSVFSGGEARVSLPGRAKRPLLTFGMSAHSISSLVQACVSNFPFLSSAAKTRLTVGHRFRELKAHVSLLGPLGKILGYSNPTSSWSPFPKLLTHTGHRCAAPPSSVGALGVSCCFSEGSRRPGCHLERERQAQRASRKQNW